MKISRHFKTKQSSSFTLVEVMVSLFVLFTAIIGGMAAVNRGLDTIQNSKSRLIAANLAQEGIELIRNIRDNNWLDVFKEISFLNQGSKITNKEIPRIESRGAEIGDPWLSDYGYRKQITITGTTAGAQTNYQMKLTVYKGSGTDSGSNVYLNNHVQDDFDDIRFTKSDGTTQLDYWVESYTSGTSATVWVEFDSIPASP